MALTQFLFPGKVFVHDFELYYELAMTMTKGVGQHARPSPKGNNFVWLILHKRGHS